MHEFQWVVSDFLLTHLRTELIVSLAVLLAILVLTGVFVGRELRKGRRNDHEDQ